MVALMVKGAITAYEISPALICEAFASSGKRENSKKMSLSCMVVATLGQYRESFRKKKAASRNRLFFWENIEVWGGEVLCLKRKNGLYLGK